MLKEIINNLKLKINNNISYTLSNELSNEDKNKLLGFFSKKIKNQKFFIEKLGDNNIALIDKENEVVYHYQLHKNNSLIVQEEKGFFVPASRNDYVFTYKKIGIYNI